MFSSASASSASPFILNPVSVSSASIVNSFGANLSIVAIFISFSTISPVSNVAFIKYVPFFSISYVPSSFFVNPSGISMFDIFLLLDFIFIFASTVPFVYPFGVKFTCILTSLSFSNPSIITFPFASYPSFIV